MTRRDPYKVYHRVDRAGLADLAKTFPWEAYFAGIGFPALQTISVNEPSYFTGIDALMHEEKPEAWRHYLAWHVVRAEAHLLGKAFIDESFAMRQKLTGQKELQPRWKRCVRDVDGSLGELLAQPYVAARFAGDSKERANGLVQSIAVAMRRELRGAAVDGRGDAQGGADEAQSGAPREGRLPGQVAVVHDFEVGRTSYAQNSMAADRFEQHRQLAKIGKPVDRTEWGMTPQTVNAYYNPTLNEIVLPGGHPAAAVLRSARRRA